MEKEGIVSKIIYKNEHNQYVVFAVETKEGEDETFVGYLTGLEEGIRRFHFGFESGLCMGR